MNTQLKKKNVTRIFFMFFTIVTIFSHPTVSTASEFTDSDGFKHQFDKPFSRIISLYPAHTENIALMGGADSLIGISSSDTDPDLTTRLKQYSFRDPVEKFIQARPDCILIRPMIRNSAGNLIEKLSQYGIKIISLQPGSVAELYDYWAHLGLICGKPENAFQMTHSFKTAIEALRQRVARIEPKVHVYFESIHSRMRTFSPESISMFCLETAGGINVAVDAVPRKNTNIAGYTKEKILQHSDMIDVFLAQKGRMNPVTVEMIKNEPGFGAIKAVKNDRVFLVDETLVSRPTPRLLEGIDLIHQYLYAKEASR